jgi:hypothetical protein
MRAWLLRIPTCEMIFNDRKAVAATPAAEKETTGRQKTGAGVMDREPLDGKVALSPVAIPDVTSPHMHDEFDAALTATVARGRGPGWLPNPVPEMCKPDLTWPVTTAQS